MNQRVKLDLPTIEEKLKGLPGWSHCDGQLVRDYQFPDFSKAFGYMASCALVAEGMNHHPDWSNVYGTVKMRLSTHDVDVITEQDFKLASACDERARALGGK